MLYYLVYRSGSAVAVAGGGWGFAGCVDGYLVDVHALIPEETPLPRPRAACREKPSLAEGESVQHRR